MDKKELEQAAVQTFCIIPEVYQAAFHDAGANFPDELVAQIKKQPNEAVKMVEQDKNLKEAIVQIFSQNPENIMRMAQESRTGMFKKGGKLDYFVKKFGRGGRISKFQHGGGGVLR